MELDNGPLAGMPRDVAAERYPKPGFRNPYEPIYSTGESEWEIYRRGAREVEKIVRRGAGSYLVQS
jgi:2,3-bisphosphoglycerate-dependent phosphoglycerate mutase